VLEQAGFRIAEERSTRASPLTEAEARALLREVDEVWIARGPALERRPSRAVRAADLRGPTGRIRAPIVRRGAVLLVGFREEGLRELVRR
jgi:hypothetical protein